MAYIGLYGIICVNLVNLAGKVADMIVQIYATIRDYRGGLYPNYKYEPKKQVFPLLLALEDLYLFGPTIENELRASILKKFKERNLDEAWLEAMPYSVCCIEEFERMMQVIATVGIAPFVGKKVFDKDRIALIPDHFAPNKDIQSAEQTKMLRDFAKEHNLSLYFEVPTLDGMSFPDSKVPPLISMASIP